MHTSEQLTIDTPEQVALELPIAGIGSRFLALAVDTLVQFFLYLIIFLALLGLAVARVMTPAGDWGTIGAAIAVLLVFVIYWGYFSLFEIFWHGQTPGKRAAGVRVIKDTGRPADVTAVLLRNFLRVIDFLPAMYAAGLICMALNRHSRRIGDFVAGTVVVHDRPPSPLDAGAADTNRLRAFSAGRAFTLADEEVVLIETYLARRFELSDRVQYSTATRIVERITARTGVAPAPGQSVDEFLETIAREARDSARYR